jgi:hypothetical protein
MTTPQKDLRAADTDPVPFAYKWRQIRESWSETRQTVRAIWGCVKYGHDLPTVEESLRTGSGQFCRRCGGYFGGEQSGGG